MSSVNENISQNKIDIVTNVENNVTVNQPTTSVVTVTTQGPRGAVGPAGPQGEPGAAADVSALNTFTGSAQTNLNALNEFTSSVVLTSQTSSMSVATASYALFAVSASVEITKEVSSSFADTASYVNTLNQNVIITGSLIASGISYPTIDGSNGQTLITDGAGNLSFGLPEKLHLQVRNDDSVDITAGTPIYSTGEIGGSERIKVRIAKASDSSKMPAIGIVETTLTTTGDTKDGFAIINGIYNTNITPVTGTPALGDNIYIHANGGVTTIKPSGSNLIQNIGTVLKTNGTIIQGMKVSSIDRTNDVPNLLESHIFFGSGSNQQYQLHISGALDRTLINHISASGNISASSISAFEMNVTHFTASFITASTIQTSGSNIFGDEASDTHTFIGDIIADNNISSSGFISGSVFSGDGSGLINIPATGITGLNLSQIASGSVTASIAPDKGFQVNTDTQITGSLTISGSVPSGSVIYGPTNDYAIGLGNDIFFGGAGDIASKIQFKFPGTSYGTGYIGMGSDYNNTKLSIRKGNGNILSFSAGSTNAGIGWHGGTISFGQSHLYLVDSTYRATLKFGNRYGQPATTDGTGVIQMLRGGAPTTDITDCMIIYAGDSDGAGTVSPHFRTEDGRIISLGKKSVITGSLIVSSSDSTASLISEGDAQITGSLEISGSILIPNSGSGITINSGSLNVKSSVASANIATFTPVNSAGRVEINDAEIKVTGTTYGYTAGRLYSSVERIGEFSLHYWSGITGVYIRGNANEGGSTWQQNFIGGGLHVGSRKTAGANSVPFAFSVNGPSQLSGSLLVSGSVDIEQGFNISGSATSTASFGTYLGDGSGLTGIVTETNFTQSLFVSPSGDDATAAVGDMMKPFATILAATASANIGDTIIVYPGIYEPTSQIIKDKVNYYFHPGAIVTGSFTLLSGTFEELNVRGYGIFDTNFNGSIISITANGVFECDTVRFGGLQSSGYAGAPSFAQDYTTYPNRNLTITGKFKYGKDGARTGNGLGGSGLSIGGGNIVANVDVHVSSSSGMPGIRLASGATDALINATVYANMGTALYSNQRISHTTIKGTYETGDQSTYYAIELSPGYVGNFFVDATMIGAIKLGTGGVGQSGVDVRGFQTCANSPSSLGAVQLSSAGYYTLHHRIEASENIFYQPNAYTYTTYTGNAQIMSNNTGKMFDIRGGRFIWKGSAGDKETRSNQNTVSGGELIIDSPLIHYGSSYPSNRFCFNLTGGTLEINNKLIYHQNTTGSGIIDMSGGYLKLNGAQLIHADGTGSYAYAIDLNSGAHSGSIFNNSFTNLRPFGPGSFTNEIVGGGTLFESHKLY